MNRRPVAREKLTGALTRQKPEIREDGEGQSDEGFVREAARRILERSEW